MADDSVIGRFRNKSGAINYVRASMFENRPVPFETQGNLPIGMDLLQSIQATIREAFYEQLFNALIQGGKSMTVPEVEQRIAEKLILFAPIVARFQAEKLTPMIVRVFGIMQRNMMLPPLPPELQEAPSFEIEYVSKLAMAMKSIDINAIQQTLMMAQPYMQLDPSIMDNFNFNNITVGTAMRNNVPAEFMNSPDVVAQIRAQRAKQEEEMRQVEMINKMADSASKAKDVAQAQTQGA